MAVWVGRCLLWWRGCCTVRYNMSFQNVSLVATHIRFNMSIDSRRDSPSFPHTITWTIFQLCNGALDNPYFQPKRIDAKIDTVSHLQKLIFFSSIPFAAKFMPMMMTTVTKTNEKKRTKEQEEEEKTRDTKYGRERRKLLLKITFATAWTVSKLICVSCLSFKLWARFFPFLCFLLFPFVSIKKRSIFRRRYHEKKSQWKDNGSNISIHMYIHDENRREWARAVPRNKQPKAFQKQENWRKTHSGGCVGRSNVKGREKKKTKEIKA